MNWIKSMKKYAGRLLFLLAMGTLLAVLLAGCGEGETGGIPQIPGLDYENTVTPEYAEGFAIYEYAEDYSVIDTKDGNQYLVVPDGAAVPQDLPEGMVVIQENLENIYLGATSAMALVYSIGSMDQVTMTEMKESGWAIENVRKAMRDGELVYAGKYSEPDYELILSKNCDLAVESTMIYHAPEVKEMLEKLGIPVFVDRSSYEQNPLGRTEWVKVYGVLTGAEDEAEAFFEEQKRVLGDREEASETGKKVAFFYITASGKVVVRSSTDYIPAMIDMAGGVYAFPELTDDNEKSSVSMTLESFYEGAQDADIILYNGTIDQSVTSMADLLAKSEVFRDFKAVEDNRCYRCDRAFYQRTDMMAYMIMDMSRILTEENPEGLQFFQKLQ